MAIKDFARVFVCFCSLIGCAPESATSYIPTTPTTPSLPETQFTISGSVSEAGGGVIAGAEISAYPNSARTISNPDGSFSFRAPVSSIAVLVQRSGFELVRQGWRGVAEEVVLDVKMQRVVRVGVESTTSLTLYSADPGQEPGFSSNDIWCEPCKLIRVESDSARDVELFLAWLPTAALRLWTPGSLSMVAPQGQSAVRRRFRAVVGETLIYVGAGAYIEHISAPVPFTLTMTTH